MQRSRSIFNAQAPSFHSEPIRDVRTQVPRPLDVTRSIAYRLGLYSLLYSQFTTIVAASWADSVVDVVSATVRAESQCWHFCLVVSTTFRGSGVRLSSFWMCHNSLLFYFVIFNVVSPAVNASSSHAELPNAVFRTFVYQSSSSTSAQRWSWRSASISGLQPPSW